MFDQQIPADRPSGGAARPMVAGLRQIHRWLALPFGLFLGIIAITGGIMQTILSLYGEPDGPRGAYTAAAHVPGWVIALRHTALQIHTGFLIGLPGAYYGLICGLALFFFSLSGLWMYLNLYGYRHLLGRRALFWRSRLGPDGALRSLHRWFAVVLVLFTTLLSFTGANLDFDFVRSNAIPGGAPKTAPATTPAPAPMPGGARSAKAIWHSFNFTVHKLDFLGMWGHVLGVFIALGLLTFAVTGVGMVVATHAQRARGGKSGWFWR